MAQSPKHPFANVLLSKNLDHCSTGRSLQIRIEKMVLMQERATVAFQPGSDREIIRFSYRCSRKEGIRRDNEKRNFLLEYQPEGDVLIREKMKPSRTNINKLKIFSIQIIANERNCIYPTSISMWMIWYDLGQPKGFRIAVRIYLPEKCYLLVPATQVVLPRNCARWQTFQMSVLLRVCSCRRSQKTEP